jgi:hypothetical protein
MGDASLSFIVRIEQIIAEIDKPYLVYRLKEAEGRGIYPTAVSQRSRDACMRRLAAYMMSSSRNR